MASFPLGRFRDEYMLATIDQVARVDPLGALDILKEQKGTDGYKRAYYILGSALSNEDPESAIGFSTEIKDSSLRGQYIHGILSELSKSKP